MKTTTTKERVRKSTKPSAARRQRPAPTIPNRTPIRASDTESGGPMRGVGADDLPRHYEAYMIFSTSRLASDFSERLDREADVLQWRRTAERMFVCTKRPLADMFKPDILKVWEAEIV